MRIMEKQPPVYSYTYRFSHNSRRYAFDFAHLLLAELDELFDQCFDWADGMTTPQEIAEIFGKEACQEALESLCELIGNGFFYGDQDVIYTLPKAYPIGLLSLPTVHACNLRCAYCFAEHGERFQSEERQFTGEMVEKALRYVYYEYMPQCKRYRIDFVSGGEPLLNFDIIRDVRRVSDELLKETGKPLEIWVCTNGTVFKPDVLSFLDEHRINIGISLDGDRETHDAMRKDANGEGTYDRVVKAIRDIKESDIYSRKLKDIWGLVVITSRTKSIRDILIHHRGIGLKNVQMKLVRLKKDAPFAITAENVNRMMAMYTELFDFFKEQLMVGSVDYLKMILNDNDFAGKIIRRLLMRYVVISRCQAGKNKVSIAANGDLYPCDSFVGTEEYRLGNIFTGLNKQLPFADMTIHQNASCRNCWARFVCGGDCYHNSYLVNGAIDEPDTVICQLEKHLIREALVFVDLMSNEYPDTYAYLQNFLNTRDTMQKGEA